MEPVIPIIGFFAVLAFALAITSCAQTRRRRVVGAVVAFGWSCLMFMAASTVESFNLNIWYSSAADGLLESSVVAIEAGQADRVATELSAMREKLAGTYEHRGNFNELAAATAKRIRSATETGDTSRKRPRPDEMPSQ